MFILLNVFEFSEGSRTSVSTGTSILPYTRNIYFIVDLHFFSVFNLLAVSEI